MILQQGMEVDKTTEEHWVQIYASEMDKRYRAYVKQNNDSWRIDETYIKAKVKWKYFARAVDSDGKTLQFVLNTKRDALAAERFLSKRLKATHNPSPRVINVDKNADYLQAITQLQSERKLLKLGSYGRINISTI